MNVLAWHSSPVFPTVTCISSKFTMDKLTTKCKFMAILLKRTIVKSTQVGSAKLEEKHYSSQIHVIMY